MCLSWGNAASMQRELPGLGDAAAVKPPGNLLAALTGASSLRTKKTVSIYGVSTGSESSLFLQLVASCWPGSPAREELSIDVSISYWGLLIGMGI